MFLIAGLGNPGRDFEGTRHNVGFQVIDYLSKKYNVKVSKIKFKGLIGEFILNGEKVILLKPSTFMNSSGESVREAAEFYKIPVDNIIVVYDEMALDLGRIRLRPFGSDGGHNGMKSIIYLLNSDQFPRVRVGIGSPRENMVNHVLGHFSVEDKLIVDKAVEAAGDSIIDITQNGIEKAMNKYNSFKVSQE